MGSDHVVLHQDTNTDAASLVDLLQRRTARASGSALFRFLPDGEEGAEVTLTPGELDLRARALAARLQDLGLTGGARLLLYPPGLEFIAAFFGCLYAGVVAVAAHLPRPNRPITRLRSIVADCGPCAVLTCSSLAKDAARWEAGVTELRGVPCILTDERPGDFEERAGHWSDPGAGRETIAMLQYTSGSTTTPRGVMITHGNLLQNSSLIHEAFGSTPEARGVFWLPLFHDMGLIGGVIQTLYCGGSSTLFSPVSFLQRPIRWLQSISLTGATISGAPNFAYELCVEKTTPEQQRRPGPEHLACRVQRRRADPRGDPRSIRRGLRAGRVPPRVVPPLLRPGRGDAAGLRRAEGPRSPSSSRSTARPSGAARSAGPGRPPRPAAWPAAAASSTAIAC